MTLRNASYLRGSDKFPPFTLQKTRRPDEDLAYLDTQTHFVFNLLEWPANLDTDQDGMNDTNDARPTFFYNGALPKIHVGGCNVVLLDGHVEWIVFETFFETDQSFNPIHKFWYIK